MFQSPKAHPINTNILATFLRSGGTTSAGPIARTGPTRHSRERILVVDTNT
jgi:hypothetical protein